MAKTKKSEIPEKFELPEKSKIPEIPKWTHFLLDHEEIPKIPKLPPFQGFSSCKPPQNNVVKRESAPISKDLVGGVSKIALKMSSEAGPTSKSMTKIGMSHSPPSTRRVRNHEPSPKGLEVAGTSTLAELLEAGKSPHS
jgi:hypothetical protein